MLSTNSSNGIVRNRDSLLIELSCCATECSSNPGIWLRAQSTFGWLRFGDWRTRPRMLVYLARNWLLVYVALRVQRSSVSGLEIGYPRVRRALCGGRALRALFLPAISGTCERGLFRSRRRVPSVPCPA